MFKVTNKRELFTCLYGFVMGDGGVYRQKHKGNYFGNASFIANNIEDNLDYILWRKSVLEEITNVRISFPKDVHTDGCTRRQIVRTDTRTHPIYTKLWNRLYSTGRKVVDKHQLKFMSWEFLAILFQEDGSCSVDKRCNASPSVQIATKSFSYPENMAIKLAIKEKLGIDFNVHKQTRKDRIYWYLALPTRYYDVFRYNIEPFIFDSFRYKIPENTSTRNYRVPVDTSKRVS